MSLTKIMEGIRRELSQKSDLREKTLINARKVTQLSKEAIILIHSSNFRKARARLKKAENLLHTTLVFTKSSPELQSSGTISSASQEYTEALILLKLKKNDNYPTYKEVGVASQDYILGLADVIGELRREALEAMKNRKLETAEKYADFMESIYNELVTLNEHVFTIVPELRRKCDVARRLIELTVSDVMLERRQRRLEKSLELMERKTVRSRRL